MKINIVNISEYIKTKSTTIREYLEQKIKIKENIEANKLLMADYIIQKITLEDSKNNG